MELKCSDSSKPKPNLKIEIPLKEESDVSRDERSIKSIIKKRKKGKFFTLRNFGSSRNLRSKLSLRNTEGKELLTIIRKQQKEIMLKSNRSVRRDSPKFSGKYNTPNAYNHIYLKPNIKQLASVEPIIMVNNFLKKHKTMKEDDFGYFDSNTKHNKKSKRKLNINSSRGDTPHSKKPNVFKNRFEFPKYTEIFNDNFHFLFYIFKTAEIENEKEGKETKYKVNRDEISTFNKLTKNIDKGVEVSVSLSLSKSALINKKSKKAFQPCNLLANQQESETVKNSVIMSEVNEIESENSFIKSTLKDTTNPIRESIQKQIYLANYKHSKNFYQNDKNLKLYRRQIYLPLLIKYTKKIIHKQFKCDKNSEEKYKEFYTEFNKVYKAIIVEDREYLNDKLIEDFLDVFRCYTFEKLIKSIARKSHGEEIYYSKTKLVFSRLYNNLKKKNSGSKYRNIITGQSIEAPHQSMYERLSEKLLSILTFKSKNFYLQESLDYGKFKRLTLGLSNIKTRGMRNMISILGESSHQISQQSRENYKIKSGNKIYRGVLLPYSFYRLIWDFMISLSVIYNLIYIPIHFIEVNFSGIYIKTEDVFNMIIDGFTFLDIVLNFRTGYIDENNNIVTDLKEIRLHYLKSWLLTDICSTFPWEILIMGSSANMLNLFKLPRVLRVNRLIKLTEKLNKSLVRLITLIVIFFLFAHWTGCFIYALLDYSFIRNNFSPQENIYCPTTNLLGGKDFRPQCKYVFSLYNGMSILMGQDINLESNNALYTFIFFFAYFLGKIAFSIIIGLISASADDFEKMYSLYTEKVALINDQLDFYHIEGDIRRHINTYYDYVWSKHKEIGVRGDCVNSLSLVIQEKVLAQRYRHIIPKLNFLSELDSDDYVLGKILRLLKQKIFMPFEVVFREATVSEGLFIFEKGCVCFEVKVLKDKEKDKFNLIYPLNKEFKANREKDYGNPNDFKDKNIEASNVDYNEIEKKETLITKKVSNGIEKEAIKFKINILPVADEDNKNVDYDSNEQLKSKNHILNGVFTSEKINSKKNKNVSFFNQKKDDSIFASEVTDSLQNQNNNLNEFGNSNNPSSFLFQNYLSEEKDCNADAQPPSMKPYFDVVTLMTKSCRHWCSSYTTEFTELAFISYSKLFKFFEENPDIFIFILKEAIKFEQSHKLFSNEKIYKLVSLPSSKTSKKHYKEGRLSRRNIWLEIPKLNETICLSTRKMTLTDDIMNDCNTLNNKLGEVEGMHFDDNGDIIFRPKGLSNIHINKPPESIVNTGKKYKSKTKLELPNLNRGSISLSIKKAKDKTTTRRRSVRSQKSQQ